jgi:hypothetical protein
MFNKIFSKYLLNLLKKFKQIQSWKKRNYLGNAPQFIKESIFLRDAIPNAQWVETGTGKGVTTKFLASLFPYIYTIEPNKYSYEQAIQNIKMKNISFLNDTSENILPELLSKIKGDINFWLDGHYSGEITFKGKKNCPIEEELEAISKNILNFKKITIFIDDIRCFLSKLEEYKDYPIIDFLVDWSRKNKFIWKIEHDIFIMQNYSPVDKYNL